MKPETKARKLALHFAPQFEKWILENKKRVNKSFDAYQWLFISFLDAINDDKFVFVYYVIEAKDSKDGIKRTFWMSL